MAKVELSAHRCVASSSRLDSDSREWPGGATGPASRLTIARVPLGHGPTVLAGRNSNPSRPHLQPSGGFARRRQGAELSKVHSFFWVQGRSRDRFADQASLL